MTHFLDAIFRQPNSLLSTMDYLAGAGQPMLESARFSIRVFRPGLHTRCHRASTLCGLPARFGDDRDLPRRTERRNHWPARQVVEERHDGGWSYDAL
jgi:hypothetical protein